MHFLTETQSNYISVYVYVCGIHEEPLHGELCVLWPSITGGSACTDLISVLAIEGHL